MTLAGVDLSTFGPWSPMAVAGDHPTMVAPQNQAWGTANIARGGWFLCTQDVTVSGIRHNADTHVGTINIDKGLYDEAGNLLASTGSVVAATGGGYGVVTSFSGGDVDLVAGTIYYLALTCDSSTLALGRYGFSTAAQNRVLGAVEKTSTFPLSDPITWAVTTATSYAVPMLALVISGSSGIDYDPCGDATTTASFYWGG